MSKITEPTLLVKPGRNVMEGDPYWKSEHMVGGDPRSHRKRGAKRPTQ